MPSNTSASGVPLLDDVAIDVSFLIQETFYFGPENNFTQSQWEAMREPLHQPKLKIRNSRVTLGDARGQPEELLAYYRSVIDAAQRHEKQLKPAAPDFWLRPDFWRSDELLISCHWHDTVEEADAVLEALSAEGDGEIYSYVEQGFELSITADSDELTILESDPDSHQVQAHFRCERSRLANQATVARTQLQTVIAWLVEKTGKDFWTYAPAIGSPWRDTGHS